MGGLTMLAAASASFVGSHFILSHPLRAPLVARIGERGFILVYSLVAVATLGWMAHAYRTAPPEPLWWEPGDGLWIAASLVMWLAAVLFAGSLVGNPALPAPGAGAAARKAPRGVFRITRHPMMWAFALWGFVHIAVWPSIASLILCGAIIILALVGARLQDAKKAALMGDDWRHWSSVTSYWPFARGFALPGAGAIVGGTAFWLLATWLHTPAGVMAAGIWRWLG